MNLAEQDLQSKLRELVPYVSTIIQAPISSDSEYLSFKHNQEIKHEVITDIETAQSLISNIVNTIAASYYENYGRSYSNAFIASVLVAFFQSFISVFAGPPGLGKTSFIRLLREILKLDERFLEVSVSISVIFAFDLGMLYCSMRLRSFSRRFFVPKPEPLILGNKK